MEAVLCFAGWLAASLVSAYKVSVVPLSLICENQKRLQTLMNVCWWEKSPTIENHWSRSREWCFQESQRRIWEWDEQADAKMRGKKQTKKHLCFCPSVFCTQCITLSYCRAPWLVMFNGVNKNWEWWGSCDHKAWRENVIWKILSENGGHTEKSVHKFCA